VPGGRSRPVRLASDLLATTTLAPATFKVLAAFCADRNASSN